MSQPVSFMVRRPCRHGNTHPHAYYGFAIDLHGGTNGEGRWCTAGDFTVYSIEELASIVAGTLANQSPRMPIAEVAEKTDQIVENLLGRLRLEASA